MSSGKKQQVASAAPIQQASLSVPEQTDFSRYTPQGVGPTPVPQTFNAQSKPAWMNGVWDMPNWGMSASNPTQAVPTEQLQAQAYVPPAPAQQQAQTPQQQFYSPGSSYAAYDEFLRQKALNDYAIGLTSNTNYSPG